MHLMVNSAKLTKSVWLASVLLFASMLFCAVLADEKTGNRVVPADTGPVIEFAGFDSCVEVDHVPLDKFESFTMEAWVKDWHGRIVYEGKQSDPENSIWFGLDRPGSTFGWESGDGVDVKYKVERPFPAGWTHVALVYDGENQKVFVNGKKLHDEPAEKPGPFDETRKLYIGAQQRWEEGPGDTQWHAFGLLAALRISSKALYKDAFMPPAKLTAEKETELLYDMSRKDDKTLYDLSSKKRNGKLVNVEWRERAHAD